MVLGDFNFALIRTFILVVISSDFKICFYHSFLPPYYIAHFLIIMDVIHTKSKSLDQTIGCSCFELWRALPWGGSSSWWLSLQLFLCLCFILWGFIFFFVLAAGFFLGEPFLLTVISHNNKYSKKVTMFCSFLLFRSITYIEHKIFVPAISKGR